VIVYTPEVGINLDMLRDDVQFLKNRYSLDVKGKSEGRLVIRSVIAIFDPGLQLMSLLQLETNHHLPYTARK
jgi:hypothetical protein